MPVTVLIYKPGESKPMAQAMFDRVSVLATALMKEAPFDRGFDMRVAFQHRGEIYGEDYKFAPLSDRVIPAGWTLSEECVVIATDCFNKVVETIKEVNSRESK